MTKPIRERDVERHLISEVTIHGGTCRKFKWIGRRNAPDRFVSFPVCGPVLVEVKRPGETWNDAQLREATRLRATGVRVFLVASYEDVDTFLRRLLRGEP